MEVERIRFERTGGFTGMHLGADIEMDELPEEKARRIIEMLDELNFQALPARISGSVNMSDEVFYTVTVDTKQWTHTVNIEESAASENLKTFLRQLVQAARQQKKS
jgi:hypothetical protein